MVFKASNKHPSICVCLQPVDKRLVITISQTPPDILGVKFSSRAEFL